MTDETVQDVPVVEPDAATDVVADADAPAPQPVIPAAPPESDKVQKRIDELIWKNAELKRQLDASQKPPTPVEPAKPIVAPTLEQFDYDQSKYQQAQNEYLSAMVKLGVSEELAKERQQAKVETREKTFHQRQQDFAKTNPEYVEKVIRADTLPISTSAQSLIKEMDAGPQVALYLVNHQEEALQIMQMSELMQARELGRIEAKLDKPVVTPAIPKVSQAPPPPAKIEATDSTVTPKPSDPESDKLSDAEWRKARDKQLARQRRAN